MRKKLLKYVHVCSHNMNIIDAIINITDLLLIHLNAFNLIEVFKNFLGVVKVAVAYAKRTASSAL